MQKTILLLALFGACFGLFTLPSGSFNGTGSFGVQTTLSTYTFTTAAGTTTNTVTLGTANGLFLTSLNATFTVSGSASGSVTVNLVQFLGASFSSFTGFSSVGSVSGATGATASANVGFVYTTTLTAGTFTFLVTLSSATSATTAIVNVVDPNLQLFYAVNTSDGSGQAYSQGNTNIQPGFFGALPSTVGYANNVAQNITFTLPPVQYAVVSAASVNLAFGTSATTPAVLPVLRGVAAKVVANVTTVYAYATNFAIALYNQATTTITTNVNTAYNANVGLTAGVSTSTATSGTVNGVTYSSSNTQYAGISYNTSVATQVGLAATLVQNTSGLVLGTGQTFVWAFYNATSNTAQILTDSVYNAASATVSIKVTHFSTYAVYSTSASNSTTTSTSASSTTATTSSYTSSTSPINTGTSGTGAASGLYAGAAIVIAAIAMAL